METAALVGRVGLGGTWPAGHPVLAVKVSRTYRALAAGKVIVTVLPVQGLKVYPADPTIVAKLDPAVLP